MVYFTLALIVVAVTLAGATLAEPFGRAPGAPVVSVLRVRSIPHGSSLEVSNGR